MGLIEWSLSLILFRARTKALFHGFGTTSTLTGKDKKGTVNKLFNMLIHNLKGFKKCFTDTQVIHVQSKTRTLYDKRNMKHSPSRPADLLKSVRGQILYFVLISFLWIFECIFHCNHKQNLLSKKHFITTFFIHNKLPNTFRKHC